MKIHFNRSLISEYFHVVELRQMSVVVKSGRRNTVAKFKRHYQIRDVVMVAAVCENNHVFVLPLA